MRKWEHMYMIARVLACDDVCAHTHRAGGRGGAQSEEGRGSKGRSYECN